MKHVFRYVDSFTGRMGGTRVENIDAIWPCDESSVLDDGQPLPAGTRAGICTSESLLHSSEDHELLINRWERQLAEVLGE